jgi:hypothetical protein
VDFFYSVQMMFEPPKFCHSGQIKVHINTKEISYIGSAE